MNIRACIAAAMLAFGCVSTAFAQAAAASAPAPAEAAGGSKGLKQDIEKSADASSFLGLLSIGYGSMNLGDADISKVSLKGGKVSVDSSSRYRNSYWLQSNWVVDKNPFTEKRLGAVRPGIWAGLELGSDNNLTSGVGVGFMLSFLRFGKDHEPNGQGLNVGWGWYRTKKDVLGPGVVEGQPLPAGVESPYTVERSVTGHMFMVSLNVLAF